MDYIEGKSLKEVLAREGAQSQERTLLWGKQLCGVLSYLHEQEPPVIYRDMKPSNIMVQPDGSLKLIDFGTARELRDVYAEDDTICLGTPGYAAPEQWEGCGQTDARTDIYCLGMVLYEIVTGQGPEKTFCDRKPVQLQKPGLSAGLEEILRKCTQRDPGQRFQSCRELIYALEHYREMDLRWRKKQKRRLSLFLAAALASLLCFLGAFYAWHMEVRLEKDTYRARLEQIASSVTKAEKHGDRRGEGPGHHLPRGLPRRPGRQERGVPREGQRRQAPGEAVSGWPFLQSLLHSLSLSTVPFM